MNVQLSIFLDADIEEMVLQTVLPDGDRVS